MHCPQCSWRVQQQLRVRHPVGHGISEATRQWLENHHNADQGTRTFVLRYNNRITQHVLQVWFRNSSTAYQLLEERSLDDTVSTSQGSNETFAYTAKTTPSTLDYNATTVGASTSCLPLKLRCTNIPTDPCQHFRFISGAPRLALLCFQAIQQFRALV